MTVAQGDTKYKNRVNIQYFFLQYSPGIQLLSVQGIPALQVVSKYFVKSVAL